MVGVTNKIINLKKRKLSTSKYQRNSNTNTSVGNTTSNNIVNNKRKLRSDSGFFGDLQGFVTKVATTLATLGLVNWLGDSKNKDSIVNILKFAKGIFDIASKVAEFGVDALLSGLSEITSGSILERMFGILKAVTGFMALKWLISPMKMFGDIKGFIKFIKDIPANIQKLTNLGKTIASTVSNLLKWSGGLAKGIYKGLSAVFTKAIVKVFGQSSWNLFKAVAQKAFGTVTGGVGKLGGNVGKAIGGFASKYISKSVIRAAGGFLSKIPIVGSLIGFAINLVLGDPVEKAAFKLATATVGSVLGGAVGSFFPPALPFTVPIGGLLGDFLGDKLFDFFVPPKLALGGIVSHQSTAGTHVIVAEKEDEVVIPLSMLTMENFAGSSFYESIKLVGSSILGAVQSVISNMGGVGNSIYSSISQFISPLIKIFGMNTYNSTSTGVDTVSSNVSAANLTASTINTNSNILTDINIIGNILGIAQLSSVTASSNVDSISDVSVRGLLRGILDVVANGNLGTPTGGIVNQMISTVQHIGQNIQSSVQSAFNNIQGNITGGGIYIASGRATYYDPNDKSDKTAGGHKLSTGETYSSTSFSGAAFPDLILKLPESYTAPTRSYPAYFKGKTIRKPFMLKVEDPATGKVAIVRVNDVGIGVLGDHTRILDMSAATKKYFGGDSPNLKYYLAPANSTPGPIKSSNNAAVKKKYSEGGEYAYKSAKPHVYGAPRRNRTHAGQDIPIAKDGTFQSFLGGSVVYKGYESGKNKYGNYIDIYNEQKQVVERIAEIGDIRVNLGDIITPGQVIGSGTSTGVIHYEIRPMTDYNTQYGHKGTVNPINYLSDSNIVTISDGTFKFNSQISNIGTGTTVLPQSNPYATVLNSDSSTSDSVNMHIMNINNAGNTTIMQNNTHDYSTMRRSRTPNSLVTKF